MLFDLGFIVSMEAEKPHTSSVGKTNQTKPNQNIKQQQSKTKRIPFALMFWGNLSGSSFLMKVITIQIVLLCLPAHTSSPSCKRWLWFDRALSYFLCYLFINSLLALPVDFVLTKIIFFLNCTLEIKQSSHGVKQSRSDTFFYIVLTANSSCRNFV